MILLKKNVRLDSPSLIYSIKCMRSKTLVLTRLKETFVLVATPFSATVKPRGVHKHFFDRDARPRTNFNYPKK